MLAGDQVCPFAVPTDGVGIRSKGDRVRVEVPGAGANGGDPEVEGRAFESYVP